ncbi:MAG: 4Fe-4S dicluster domain-containing protein [Coriobacteriales bacterium]|nr:4Fe-4S dicluster domain-containing protein [Coriobacteriales bacterium]
MSDIQEAMRSRAKELLESGEVNAVIGWEAGRFENQTTPLITSQAAKTQRLVFNEYCVNNLGKYPRDLTAKGKVAIFARGCESRAIIRLLSDEVIKRENVYIIGIGCPGMRDRTTGELLKKCAECRHGDPVIYDEMLGEPQAKPATQERFAEIQKIEALPRAEREAYFTNAFSKCIRCYACRNVCPCCTCRQCFVDQRREGWLGKQNNIAENRFYGLTRVMHVGDRCIECGECERVCPMDLPLMSLNRKVIYDINNLFGEYETALSLDEPPSALTTYKVDDVEEFM